MKDDKLKNLCEDLIDNITVIKGFVDLNRKTAGMKYSNELMGELTEMTTKIKGYLIEKTNRNNFKEDSEPKKVIPL